MANPATPTPIPAFAPVEREEESPPEFDAAAELLLAAAEDAAKALCITVVV